MITDQVPMDNKLPSAIAAALCYPVGIAVLTAVYGAITAYAGVTLTHSSTNYDNASGMGVLGFAIPCYLLAVGYFGNRLRHECKASPTSLDAHIPLTAAGTINDSPTGTLTPAEYKNSISNNILTTGSKIFGGAVALTIFASFIGLASRPDAGIANTMGFFAAGSTICVLLPIAVVTLAAWGFMKYNDACFECFVLNPADEPALRV